MSRPTLILQTTYFDESDEADARRLGQDLYETLTRPIDDPLGYGPSIPVLSAVHHKYVDLQSAEIVVVIPVLGKLAHGDETTRQTILDTLAAWHKELGPGHLLPLPVSAKWRNDEPSFLGKLLLSELYGPSDLRRQTIEEIVLNTMRLLSVTDGDNVLFVSHAKADERATGNVAKSIYDHIVAKTTGEAFFDTTKLLPGDSLDEQLENAASHGALLTVRTDKYSSRVWCQREVLTAKRRGLATITVEVLRTGEHRSSRYGGNCPTAVWKDDPSEIALRAMVECLRAAHFRREGERIKQAAGLPCDITILIRPPELLDIAQGPVRRGAAELVLHPDPELTVLEKKLLRAIHSRLYFVTPTTVFRRVLSRAGSSSRGGDTPLEGLQIAMSLSDSPDADGLKGFTKHHIDDATIYLARTLISAGAGIAYGGDFRNYGFTNLLAELIQAYNQTAAEPAQYLHSYLGAPIPLAEVPDNLPFTLHHLDKHSEMRDLARLPKRQDGSHPNGIYFSDMRQAMEQKVFARVILGGDARPNSQTGGDKPDGYGGRYPGVVEEAWRALETFEKVKLKGGHPLYVIGGFGGASALVAELIRDREKFLGADKMPDFKKLPDRLKDSTWSENGRFTALKEQFDSEKEFRSKLGLPDSIEDLAARILALSEFLLASDEASKEWNGLTIAENLELFETRDPIAIATLVTKGLLYVDRIKAEGKLDIELIQGSIIQSNQLNAVAIATFDDIPLGGAGAALDKIVGGVASEARTGARSLIQIKDSDIDADWLYLASLGPLGDGNNLAARIRLAAERTADVARRHGLNRLGVVAYGGTVVDDRQAVTDAMVLGLKSLAGFASVSWFESNKERFQAFRNLLQSRIDVKLTTKDLTALTPVTPGRPEPLILQLAYRPGELLIRIVPPAGNGVVEARDVALDEIALAKFGEGSGIEKRRSPEWSVLEARGVELAELLMGPAAEQILSRCGESKIVVVHDVASSRLPLEMLSTKLTGPLASTVGVNRRLAIPGVSIDHLFGRPAKSDKFNVLLVVNPTGDLKGTTEEGEAIEAILKQLASRIKLTVLPTHLATKENVLRELVAADVLHYCGHGFYNGPGEHQSGLELADGKLTLEDIRSIELTPRVAFMNACEAARVRGDVPEATPAASFAEFFLRGGVEAYLGTYWRVNDTAATDFAGKIYQELAAGRTLDEAVIAGRRLLLDQRKSDWSNYILYGDGRFRLIAE